MMNCFQQKFTNIDSHHSLVLTPNKRLAARLQQDYAYAQHSLVWSSPQIIPFDSFLEICWQNLLALGHTQGYILLNPQQANLLWQEIINEDPEYGNNLLNLAATTLQAQQAWQLLQQWQLDLHDPRLAVTEDQLLFLKWALRYQEVCQTRKFIDHTQLQQQVQQAFKAKLLTNPKHLTFASFTELRPDIASLISLLESQGTIIDHWQVNIALNSAERLSFSDCNAEITTMAQWAKATHIKNAKAQIACVVPQLTSLRTQVEQIFYRTFNIDQQITNNLPFTISSGIAFAEVPLIAAALNCLLLKHEIFSLATITHFLQSPFFVSEEAQLYKQALFATQLQQTQCSYFSAQQLTYHLQKFSPTTNLKTRLSVFFGHSVQAPRLPSQWAEFFSLLLYDLDWPGICLLNSSEYQASQRWLRLLNEFASLDLIIRKPLDYAHALKLLQNLARQTTFQAESGLANIHILGTLEAVGMPFDYLWVMGLDHKNWPSSARPNPFLPIYLQRELAMPHCSAQRELAFSEQVTAQLLQSTKNFIASYTTQHEEEILHPSPLITHLSTSSIENLLPSNPSLAMSEIKIQQLVDELSSAVPINAEIRGGTGIIKQQAACPFRAFAEYRLNAKAIETSSQGISAKTKGILLHKSLEILWGSLGSQAKLLALTATDKLDLIHTSIEQACKKIFIPTDNYALIKIEKQRLAKILFRWLEHEAQRQPFTVFATEHQQTIKIDQLPLRIQIDRIDQQADGTHVLLDYKTGKISINDWFGQRPNEPQLPLYAITHDYPITAMAFAQLKSDEMRFKGIQLRENDLPNCDFPEKIAECAVSWQEQLTQWRKTLVQLANDFINGHSEVDPKNLHKTCEHCHLHSLCRIHDEV